MTILDKNQRAVIQLSTQVDPLIVDRVVESYDALLVGNLEEYKQKMFNAYTQQNLPLPIPQHERPCAVDKVKTICIKAISDQKRWNFWKTAKWLEGLTK